MLSHTIMARINTCRSNIEECAREITALHGLIENKEGEYGKFIDKSGTYDETVRKKLRRAQAVYEHEAGSVLAKKFYERMDFTLNESSLSRRQQDLIYLEELIRGEIAADRNRLNDLHAQKSSLCAQLAGLRAQYEAAAAAEAEAT